MSALIVAVLPFVVNWLVALLKRIPVVDHQGNGVRVAIIRLIAAVLSFLGVVGAFMTTGTVDTVGIETFVLSLVTFLSATGIHELFKKK